MIKCVVTIDTYTVDKENSLDLDMENNMQIISLPKDTHVILKYKDTEIIVKSGELKRALNKCDL